MNDASEEIDVENWGQHDKWWKEELWSRRELEALSYDQLNEIIKPYREARLPVPAMDITSHTIIRDELDRCLKIMEYMVGRPKEFPQQLNKESEEEPYKSMGFGLHLWYERPFGNAYREYYRRTLNGFKEPWEIDIEKRKADEERRRKEWLEKPENAWLKKRREEKNAEAAAAKQAQEAAAQQDSGVKGMNSAVHNPYSVHLSI